MSSNKGVKHRLIQKYGKECFIDKLHLRPQHPEQPKRYTSKGQLKRMRQLTYHHIKPKAKGGKATEYNGAVLSADNHAWFHRQPQHIQRRLNLIFLEYKFACDETQTKLTYDEFISSAKHRQEQIVKAQREAEEYER